MPMPQPGESSHVADSDQAMAWRVYTPGGRFTTGTEVNTVIKKPCRDNGVSRQRSHAHFENYSGLVFSSMKSAIVMHIREFNSKRQVVRQQCARPVSDESSSSDRRTPHNVRRAPGSTLRRLPCRIAAPCTLYRRQVALLGHTARRPVELRKSCNISLPSA